MSGVILNKIHGKLGVIKINLYPLFIFQVDEAVHHDQLVMLEKLYNALTKVDLAAGNQVSPRVFPTTPHLIYYLKS